MSRRRVTCLIQLDHAPFWPIGVHTRALVLPRYGELLGCRPRNSVIPGHDLGRLDGMHANATPGAAWMSRHRLTCLIQLDHSPFWPIGVHSGHVDTPRCSWVCAGMKANPHDRSGGLPDRPDVPTDCLSRQISIGTASYAREGWSGSVVILKRSSYMLLPVHVAACQIPYTYGSSHPGATHQWLWPLQYMYLLTVPL